MRNILATVLVMAILVSCAPTPNQTQANTLSQTPTVVISASSINEAQSSTPTNFPAPTNIPFDSASPAQGVLPILVNDKLFIDSIAVENADSIWLIGIGELTDDKYSLINYNKKDWLVFEIPSNMVSCYANAPLWVADLVVEKDGTVWGNSGCRIFRFDGNAWRAYSSDDGIGQGDISALVIDQSGGIWTGTEEGFVSKFDKTKWTTYSKNETTNLDGIYSGIVASDGTLWFGGLGGISHFDGEHWTTHKHRDEYNQPIEAVEIAATKDGGIWVVENAVEHAVFHFDGNNWKILDEIETRCTSIFIDQNDHVWLGAIHRLFYSTGNQWLEVPISTVAGMAQTEDGNIWLGTQGGLYLYNSNR